MPARDRGAKGGMNHLTAHFVTLRWFVLSAAIVFASAYCSIEFSRDAERIAMIWVANGLLVAILFHKPTALWPSLLTGGYLGNVAASAVTGETPWLALGLPLCNTLEVVLVALPLRLWAGRGLDLSRLSHLGIFVLLAALAPAITGAAAAALLAYGRAASPALVWASWYPADALGLLVIVPLLHMLRLDEMRALLRPDRRFETLAWFAALLAITTPVFFQSSYPLLFLPMALLGLIAVRLGPSGTALGIGLVAVAATAATVSGLGPIMLVPGALSTQVLVLQGFVASIVLSKLPITAILNDRARLDTELRDANMRLLLAEKIARVGHWRVDVASNALTWSEGVYRMHGLDPATYTPTVESAVAAYHPDDRAEVARWVGQAIEKAGEYEFSLRLLRSDGAVRDVVSRGLCETGPDGAVTAIFGTIMDVTELRQAERTAQESEARYRLLAEHASDLIALKPTFHGPRSYVSPSSRGVVGYEPEELAALSIADYVHPEDMARVAAEFASLTAETPEILSVHRLRHKAGHTIWAEAIFRLTNAGSPDQAVIVRARDVTARHEAEQALASSEARYRLLADHASDLIVLGHADGRRSYISPAVRAMLGYTVEEAHRIGMREWIHPDDVKAVFDTTRRLSAAQPTASVIYRLRHKAGHYVWAEAAFRRVEESSDVTVITAIRDVTIRVEQARQLETAKVAAEAGARIKSEFLANMSHELRTPLTGMLGVHDLLQSDPGLSPRQRHLVDLAQESGRALLTIVNDILDFSKIEAGQMMIERVPFSFRDLIEQCSRLGRETIGRKRVTLTVETDPEMPELLLGDPTRVRQVLLNLLTNAIKFTSEGAVTIRACWGDGGLRIEVVDTGVGIAQEAIPQLFERFSQADGSMARRFGGTGLGLSISKRLVELMDGTIGVESTLGRGSTFRFTLPLAAAGEDRRASLRIAPLATCTVTSRRLLVAEDNAINREIVRTVLARQGHRLTIVDDGAAAVRAFQAGAFDVILMDVQMPGMDGLSATTAIRTIERAESRAATPIVALTANAMAEEAERCRAAGMDAHVPKPIEWAQLFGVIEQLCSDRPRNIDPEPAQAAPSATPPSPVLDENVLADLTVLLGADRVSSMLIAFREEAERRLSRLEAPDATASDLAAHAHAFVSLAGQLGFIELSTLCARLEEQSLIGGGLDQLSILRATVDRASTAAALVYAEAA